MKLLVTKCWKYTEEDKDALSRLGVEIVDINEESDPLPCPADEIEGIVCSSIFKFHTIDDFPSLKYVQIASTGFNNFPVAELEARGIAFRNGKGVYAVPIAESVMAAVLRLYRDIPYYTENKALHIWKRKGDSPELCGKTVCMIGCGDIGRACAKRFAAFDCRVLGVNRTIREEDYFDKIYPLSEIPEADIYVLCLALNSETEGIIGKDFFCSMKDGSMFINVGRGPVADNKALIEELHTGRIFAYLDVFEEEPLPADSELWDLPNVFITPHSTSDGDHVRERLSKVIVGNLKDFCR